MLVHLIDNDKPTDDIDDADDNNKPTDDVDDAKSPGPPPTPPLSQVKKKHPPS